MENSQLILLASFSTCSSPGKQVQHKILIHVIENMTIVGYFQILYILRVGDYDADLK